MALTSSPNQGRLLPLGVAYTRMFFMGVTGLTLTRLQSKAGGAFGVVAGPVAEVSNGWYKLSMTTSDTDTEGDLANHLTDGGSNIVDFCDQVAAPVKLADKVAHGGDTATLKLLSLEVDNPDGTAVLFTSESNGNGLHVRSTAASGSNQNAVWFQGPRGAEVTAQGCGLLIDSGDGTGSSALGIRAFGAANSHGIHLDVTATLTNGHGILIEGSTNSADAAVYIDASINSASPGIEIVADGGSALRVINQSGSGNAALFQSGGTGDVIKVIAVGATAANGMTISASGSGTGDGLVISAGATVGNGIRVEGGSSAQNAIYLHANNGNGIVIDAGTFGIQVLTTGGPAISLVPTDGEGVLITPSIFSNLEADGIHVVSAGTGAGIHVVTAGSGSAVLLRPIDGIGLDIRPSLSAGSGADAIYIATTGVGVGVNVDSSGGTGSGVNIKSDSGRGIEVNSLSGVGVQIDSESIGLNILANGAGVNIAAAGDGISVSASGHGLSLACGGDASHAGINLDGGVAGFGATIASAGDAVRVNGIQSVDSIGRHRLLSNITKNVALANFEFVMVDSSGVPTAGLTVTGTRSIDGGAYVACTNAVTGISAGRYKISLAAADLNGGVIGLRFAASGAADLNLTIVTTP